jgi:hypothetical protein
LPAIGGGPGLVGPATVGEMGVLLPLHWRHTAQSSRTAILDVALGRPASRSLEAIQNLAIAAICMRRFGNADTG